MSSKCVSFSTFGRVVGVVGVELVGMVVQIRFGASSRVSLLMTVVLRVVGIALFSVVFQIRLGSSPLVSPAEQETWLIFYTYFFVHTLSCS